MLRKTKLYSLLLAIVFSMIVGLFSPPDVVRAQNLGCREDNPVDCPGGVVPPTDGTCAIATRPAAGQNGGENIIYCGAASYEKLNDTSYICKGVGVLLAKCGEGGNPAGSDPFFTNNEVVYVGRDVDDPNHIYIIYFPSGTNINSATGVVGGKWLQFDDGGMSGVVSGNNPQSEKSITYNPAVEPNVKIIDDAGSDGKVTNPDITTGVNPDNVTPPQEKEKPPENCRIDGIGWLVCPTVRFFARVTDMSYNILNGTLLRVQPLSFDSSGDNTSLYDSWKMMRNFANIVFILAFLFIIFSQVTSVGIGNYGIKRLLPKIIIAAILVNVSYVICALAVDISNIIGNTLKDALTSLTNGSSESLNFKIKMDIEGGGTQEYTATGWEGLSNIILGGVTGVIALGLVYVFLPVFLPILFSALLAVLTVVLVLTLRQALIIILIVVSPLAFVALLLPNTEGYFQKWKGLFTSMLLVYPAISLVFGASALASSIIMTSSNTFIVQMIGAGVSLIPLFITPIVMKVSGGLLNRWVGIMNDPSKGPIDGMRRGVEGKANRIENRRKTEALDGGGNRFGGFRYRRSAKSAAINSSLEAGTKRAEGKYISDQAQSNAGFQNELAGGTNVPIIGGKSIPGWVPVAGGSTIPQQITPASTESRQAALAGAINIEAKLEAEEVSAATAIINKLDLDKNQIQELAKGNDAKDSAGNTILEGSKGSSLQTAAIQQQFKGGDVSKTDELVALSGGMSTQQRQAVTEGMDQNSNRVLHYGKAAQEEVGKGNVNSDGDIDRVAAELYIEKGKAASSGVLTGNDKVALERYSNIIAGKNFTDSSGATRPVDTGSAAQTKAVAQNTLTNKNVPQPSDEIRWRIDAINNGMSYTSYDTARKAGTITPPPRPK